MAQVVEEDGLFLGVQGMTPWKLAGQVNSLICLWLKDWVDKCVGVVTVKDPNEPSSLVAFCLKDPDQVHDLIKRHKVEVIAPLAEDLAFEEVTSFAEKLSNGKELVGS
ncbi:hypothetical protein BT69DRAFT_1299774 [Atractiella rhizophila]|nr:hypothetical protein BT69DRAFT_1299774 [Atractiella rhizophila]